MTPSQPPDDARAPGVLDDGGPSLNLAKDPRRYLDAAAARYGSVYTLTRRQTHVRCPAAAREVLRDESTFALAPELVTTGRISIQADRPEQWRTARRLMWAHLSPRRCAAALPGLEERWQSKLAGADELTLDSLVTDTADVLWPLLLRDAADPGLRDLLLRTSRTRQRGGLHLSPWRRRTLRSLFDQVIGELTHRVDQRRCGSAATVTQQADLQTDLLDALLAGPDDSLTDLDIAQSLSICLDSAMMTTGCAAGWVASELAQYPATGLAELTDPESAARFVQEVLRHRPVIEALNRTATRQAKIGGFSVSAGDTVILESAAMHRDPHLWSEDPGSFDPERWTRTPVASRGAHLAFGAGPRFCLGLHAASAALTALVVVLARGHRLTVTREATLRQDNLNWPDGLSIGLRRAAG